MNKVLLTYIVTGDYYKFLYPYLEEYDKLFYDADKHLCVLTDKTEEVEEILKGTSISYTVLPIQHMPWPWVAIRKFSHVLRAYKYLTEGLSYQFDYVINIDASVVADRKLSIKEFTHPDKVCALKSYFWDLAESVEHRYDMFWQSSVKSVSWLDSRKIPYHCFSGFVSFPKHLVEPLCRQMEYMFKEDMRNRVIPEFHDESYFNKLISLKPDLFELFEHNVYDEEVPETPLEPNPMFRVMAYKGIQERKHSLE